MDRLPLDTILHGDCLDLLRTLPDASVDAVITDPPYGMDYQSARRIDKSKWKPKIANDRRPFIWWLYDAYRVTRDGGALLCFTDWKHQETWRMAIETAAFTVRSHAVWDREWCGMGDLNAALAPQHDIIWFATKGRFAFPNGRPKSVFRVQRLAAEALQHPTQKPVKLMRQLVRAVAPRGGIVLDPFAGSGATCEAAKLEGMHFIGMEIATQHVELAKRSVENVAPHTAIITPIRPSLWDAQTA